MRTAYAKNGWDPLKTVILGGFIPPDLLQKCLDYSKYEPIKPWLMKIAHETEEDLNNIQHILEQHGVEVLRPFNDEYIWMLEKSLWEIQAKNLPFSNLPIPISPRNDLFVYKDIVIADQPTLTKRWLDAEITNDIVFLKDAGIGHVHLPCIFRLNDTLLIGDEITDEEFERLKAVFPKDQQYIKTSIPGHVDARMATLREGLLVHSENDVPEEDLYSTFEGWTKLYCSSYGFNVLANREPHKYSKQMLPDFGRTIRSLTHGRWDIDGYNGDNAQEVVDFIDQEFTRWTGKAYETHFDVNMLTINPELSMTVGTDQDLVNRIQQQGHELITVPFRHRWFFDQGLHCITCDLVRQH